MTAVGQSLPRRAPAAGAWDPLADDQWASGCVRVGARVWLPLVVGALAGLRAQEVDCLGREPPGGAELRRYVQGARALDTHSPLEAKPAGAVRVAMGGPSHACLWHGVVRPFSAELTESDMVLSIDATLVTSARGVALLRSASGSRAR